MKGGLFDLCNLVYREENILPEKFKINCDGDGWRSPVAAGKVRMQALFSILEFKMVSQITKLKYQIVIQCSEEDNCFLVGFPDFSGQRSICVILSSKGAISRGIKN